MSKITIEEEFKKRGIEYGHIIDGDATRYWLRYSPDKVLPVDAADVIVPALLAITGVADQNNITKQHLKLARKYNDL